MSRLKRLLTVIPTHNYLSGCVYLVKWVLDCSHKYADGSTILITNDNSDQIYKPVLEKLSKHARIIDTPYAQRGGLRFGLQRAGEIATKNDYDAVLIFETDAKPTLSTVNMMINAYVDAPFGTDTMASVSPVYKNNGLYCYPTHPHWFEIGKGNCYYKENTKLYGYVSKSDAVPFLCSLWRPKCLTFIKDDFPNLVRLDTKLGQTLTKNGYYHMRLLDHSVGHENGGRRSRNGVDIKQDNITATKMLAII